MKPKGCSLSIVCICLVLIFVLLSVFTGCDNGASWNPVTVTWNGSSPGTWTGDCGGSTSISISPGAEISVDTSVNCSDNSPASYTWKVTKTSGLSEGPWTGYSLPVTFSPQSQGSFQVEIYTSCDLVFCTMCKIEIDVAIPPPPCSCVQWNPVTVSWNGITSGTLNVSSNNTTGLYIYPGTEIIVDTSVECSDSCGNTTYQWQVTKTSGLPEGPWNGNSLPVSFIAQSQDLGTFQVEIFASCDLEPCPPCQIVIDVVMLPPPCSCIQWDPVTVNWNGTSPGSWTGNCGNITGISISPGADISMNTSVQCSDSCSNTTYQWQVTKTSGLPEGPWNGNSLPVIFSPSSQGTFQIGVNGYCDGTLCQPCEFYLSVDVVQPPPCECGQWNPIKVRYWPTTTQSVNWTGYNGDTLFIDPQQYTHGMGITSSLECVNCQSTTPEYRYEYIGPGGEVLYSGEDNTFSFSTLPINAFQFVVYATCGDVECPPCVLNVEHQIGTLYEHYNPVSTDYIGLGLQRWGAQTFTAISDHPVTSVKLLLSRDINNAPWTVNVSIRAINNYGYPSNLVLAEGTTNGNTLPVDPLEAEWREITFDTPCNLISGTEYIILVQAPNAANDSSLFWHFMDPGDYADGEGTQTSNSGFTWTSFDYFEFDFLFEVWLNQ